MAGRVDVGAGVVFVSLTGAAMCPPPNAALNAAASRLTTRLMLSIDSSAKRNRGPARLKAPTNFRAPNTGLAMAAVSDFRSWWDTAK